MNLLSDNVIVQFSGYHRFLSNFYPCTVFCDGIELPTVEHGYQASKTLDRDKRMDIFMAKTPGQVKRKGQKVTKRPDWDDVKIGVMRNFVEQKFQYDAVLRGLLVETDDAYLQEGNNWGDVFWGVDLKTGKGENHLGIILMDVREKMRNIYINNADDYFI